MYGFIKFLRIYVLSQASWYEYSRRPPSVLQAKSARTVERAPGAFRRTCPSWLDKLLGSRSSATIRLAHVPCCFTTRHIFDSVPVAPCHGHLCPTPGANPVQPLDVPVREPLHIGYRASVWADWLGLFAHALALRAQADIEVCAAGEDAAAQQGSSTDGVARSWLARRHSG